MRESVYKKAKLTIFERAAAGYYNEDQRDNLLMMLESEKEKSQLSSDEIEDFFDQLSDNYPDLKDDIKKLAKKVKNASGGDSDSDDSDDSESDDDGDVNESSNDEDFYSWINTL